VGNLDPPPSGQVAVEVEFLLQFQCLVPGVRLPCTLRTLAHVTLNVKKNIAYFIIANGREETQLEVYKFPINAKDVTKLYASVVDRKKILF